MKIWTTKIEAIKHSTGELCTLCGPNIEAPSWDLAQLHCESNGLGYCVVDGELIAEIPTKQDGITPDWNKLEDFTLSQNN